MLQNRQSRAPKMQLNFATFFAFGILRTVTDLAGYNCGGTTLHAITFSTVDQPECDATDAIPINEETQIQLPDVPELKDVIRSRVEIERTIHHCGMHSHASIVQNGRQQYISNAPQDICRQMHNSGILYLPAAAQISGLSTSWNNDSKPSQSSRTVHATGPRTAIRFEDSVNKNHANKFLHGGQA